MFLAARQLLLGTSLGRAAMTARDYFRLISTPRIALGTMVNDQISSRLAVELCPADGIFVDIGAHIGSVISEVRHKRPHATIIAFEAIPDKAEALKRKFPSVTVHCCALAQNDGSQSFYVDLRESGCSSLARTQEAVKEISVETRRLDGVIGTMHVDVIKIDVEGAELGVLLGASKTIEQSRPVVMFESGPGVRLGYTKEAMFEYFRAQNYMLFAPNRLAHTGTGMSLDAFLDSHEYPRRTTNYFAIPQERELEIRERARSIKI